MTGKVIQGSFLAGQPKLPPPIPARLPSPIHAKAAMRSPGPPARAFGGRPLGPPAPAFAGRPVAVQRHGSGGAFAVEAGQVGLLSSGGKPLPDSVRGKMEAALGTDFSAVRVHVGPQAERIGAIAFTIGSDIYFAPGRYQPDTMHGQQLLGHELAHVVQQRAGRVRNPLGSGLAVVQDHALEAEADRLGQRAAAHRVTAQAKMPSGAAQPSTPVRISPPIGIGPGSYRLTAGAGGRQVGSVMVHARDRGVVEVTDLGVDQSQRGHGIGQMLVASAAKTGLQFGKSKVTLAAQDKGSGHLTQWYKQMGFTQTGVNHRGFPQLEAPISRVLAGTVQRLSNILPSGRKHWASAGSPAVTRPLQQRQMAAALRSIQRARRTNFSSETQKAVPIGYGQHRRHIIPNSLMKDAINNWTHAHGGAQIANNSAQQWLDRLNNYLPNLHPGEGIANMAAGGIMHQGQMVENKISSPADINSVYSAAFDYQKVSAFGGTQTARNLTNEFLPAVASFATGEEATAFLSDMGHSGGFDWPEGANSLLWEDWHSVYSDFVSMRDHPGNWSAVGVETLFVRFLSLWNPKS